LIEVKDLPALRRHVDQNAGHAPERSVFHRERNNRLVPRGPTPRW
jgi:hypothetical protein